MGFHRQGQPASPRRAEVTATVTRLLAQEVAFTARVVDPFGIEQDCINGRTTHEFTASCGEIVCPHCGRVAWA